MKNVVKVICLGRIGFSKAYEIQENLVKRYHDYLRNPRSVSAENTLLLLEHYPVYTIGIRRKDYSKEDMERLVKTGAEFCQTNRGGLITFHGPGQLVAYPIINLKQFEPSMKWYICQLQKTLIRLCATYNISAKTTEHTGVWVEDRKIAAIGVHGSRYITSHGIAINCNTDLSWFDHIVPCGIEGKGVTSLTKESGKNITVEDAKASFVHDFSKQFNCDISHWQEGLKYL